MDLNSSRLLACGAEWRATVTNALSNIGMAGRNQASILTLLPRVAVVLDVWFVGIGAAWAGGGGGWARWLSRSMRAGDPPVGETGEMTLGRG